jgi:hypothetical protein
MKQRVHFRLIQTPCCGAMLCYVNPRLPNYCSECGTRIYATLRQVHPESILVTDEDAWLETRSY